MTTDQFRLPAGWYADPESSGERWWNGSQWTSHTRGADVTSVVPDVSSLEGQPPVAWSAADHPVATVLDDEPRVATGVMASPPFDAPMAPAIAPGWYPDPQGLPAQRWWDGANWSPHTAPAAGSVVSHPRGYPVVQAPYGGTTVVMMPPRKSVAVALVLTFFFGPFGMFYSTVGGALFMLAVLIFGGFIAGILTFGLAWLVWWPMVWLVSMVWGCLAAAQRPASPVVHHYR
jgi:hypothetical protein